MAGSLVDLSSPETRIPSRLVIDSGVVIDWLAAVGEPPMTPLSLAQRRAIRLVEQVRAERASGFIVSTSLNEVFHYVVKMAYRADLPNYRMDLFARYPNVCRHSWEHLFKARSDLLTRVAVDLDRIRRLVDVTGLIFLQPDDLGPIPSGRTLDDELVRTMERYQLDSNDAAILVEARRTGVASIATADADLRRARIDFDVYAWL